MIKITDKPVVDSTTEGDKLLLNRDGAVKQIPRDVLMKDIEQDISNLAKDISAVAQTSAEGIVVTANGSAIAITDSSNKPLNNLIVYGSTTQNGTPTTEAPIDLVSVENPVVTINGKNLLENSLVSKTNGVTATYKHGIFTINGTATASGPQYENTVSLPAGVYTLSVEYVSGSLTSTGDNIIRIGKMGVSSKNVEITGKDSTQYTHEGGELYVGLRVNSGSVYSEYTLKVQLELGDLATEWEDFKGQTLSVPYTLNEGDYVDFGKGIAKIGDVETPLTDEEIEAFKALHTYKPNTTITNSEGAEMSVEYVADTKNYIDQKLASLVASATTSDTAEEV